MSDDDRSHRTTLPVTKDARDTLADDKPDDMSWSEYVLELHAAAPIETTEVVAIDELEQRLEGIQADIPVADLKEAARRGAADAVGELQ